MKIRIMAALLGLISILFGTAQAVPVSITDSFDSLASWTAYGDGAKNIGVQEGSSRLHISETGNGLGGVSQTLAPIAGWSASIDLRDGSFVQTILNNLSGPGYQVKKRESVLFSTSSGDFGIGLGLYDPTNQSGGVNTQAFWEVLSGGVWSVASAPGLGNADVWRTISLDIAGNFIVDGNALYAFGALGDLTGVKIQSEGFASQPFQSHWDNFSLTGETREQTPPGTSVPDGAVGLPMFGLTLLGLVGIASRRRQDNPVAV
jgi:hypothetical protein